MSTPASSPDSNQPTQPSGIGDEVSSFVHSIDALQSSFPMHLVMTTAIYIACTKNWHSFMEKNAKKDEIAQTYTIEPEHFHEYSQLASHKKKAEVATGILPQTFVTALVSQYDAFLGGLLRRFYQVKPEMLKDSERHLTYGQLCNFTDLEQAKAEILEKEIETVLRMSHSEQFESMEKRFAIPLRKGLPVWPVFIELTERRNLFAHCNGKVSAQYLHVCDRHNVDYGKRPNIGDKLDMAPDYFDRAHACIFEIGTKLAHVLWRKMLPGERHTADLNLLTLTYDLLVSKNYSLAIIMGAFSLEVIKAHSSDEIRRRMVINLAQAHKWNGRPEECKKIIDTEDWSSCSVDFKLAVAVLKGEFVNAAGMMHAIEATKIIKKADYRHWPLFNEFRTSQVFLDTYQRIYGHQLVVHVEPNPMASVFATLTSIIPPQDVTEPAPADTRALPIAQPTDPPPGRPPQA